MPPNQSHTRPETLQVERPLVPGSCPFRELRGQVVKISETFILWSCGGDAEVESEEWILTHQFISREHGGLTKCRISDRVVPAALPLSVMNHSIPMSLLSLPWYAYGIEQVAKNMRQGSP